MQTTESIRAAAVAFFPHAWNTGDVSKAADIFSPKFVDHFTNDTGIDEAAQLIGRFRTAFPDLKFTLDDEFAAENKVVHRWTMSGTHQGELMGIPPTSKAATWTGITIFMFEDGKIIERWANVDILGILQQIGVIPPPGA